MSGFVLWQMITVHNQTDEIALHQARSFFREIVATRYWNATHGGVYVPVTPETQPNPYLIDPDRDIETTQGLKLTKINPAYMSRQISEITRASNSVWFHLTSDDPVRPENAADVWESEAIQSFYRNTPELGEFVVKGVETPVYRYMAPLWVKQSCLKCHAKQGYAEGDLRGGISVTIQADHLISGRDAQMLGILIPNILIWLIGLMANRWAFGRMLKEEINRELAIKDLQDAMAEVKKLSGMLPICSSCKKVRDDKGYWNQIEAYIQQRSDAQFTHGFCPRCFHELYPDCGMEYCEPDQIESH